jgi:hypothetical protein
MKEVRESKREKVLFEKVRKNGSTNGFSFFLLHFGDIDGKFCGNVYGKKCNEEFTFDDFKEFSVLNF